MFSKHSDIWGFGVLGFWGFGGCERGAGAGGGWRPDRAGNCAAEWVAGAAGGGAGSDGSGADGD